jgi:RNA polymerase sigma-70 factor (ECF subfamily)
VSLSKLKFEELVETYSKRVLNIATRILGDIQKAQDVHQEVFLAIWKRWHKFDGQVNWSAYLYRTTVRKALEMTKTRKFTTVDEASESFATQQAPDESLKANELSMKLSKLIAKLPQRQADVFVLSRIEGVPNNQIAEMVGCSVETVRVHLHRAVKRLACEFINY